MAPSAAEPPLRRLSLSDSSTDSPFPPLEIDLSEEDLKECAYEILVAACGHNALSARTQPSRTRSGIQSITSKGLKKAAMVLGPKKDKAVHPASKDKKRPPTIPEIVQYQMQIDEDSENRIRRALLRAFTYQVGKPVECMLVPMELLLFTGPADFANPTLYNRWRKRQLRVLEAGLLVYPAVKRGGDGTLDQRLWKMIIDLQGNAVETGKHSEELSALKIAAVARAGRSLSSEHPSPHLHWADGYPLNVYLYMALLSSVFDTLEEGQLIEEIDDVLGLLKKTWGVLGVNQTLHSLCFVWTLFSRFVSTGQIEVDLLVMAEDQVRELGTSAEKQVLVHGAKAMKDALSCIHSWCEKRLLAYHEAFPKGASGLMESMLSIGLLAGRLHAEAANQENKRKRKDLSNFESEKTELYVRSSLKAAFAQMMEATDTRRRSFKGGGASRPALAVLATDISQLAEDERLKFSPVLKRWNVCAGGLAAATLHACFGREVKQFVSGLQKIGPDVLQVLQAADELEKALVQIAVEDAVDAEDGGKGLMREMQPFECESSIERLSKEWLQNALAHLVEWVGRNIQNEEWKPESTREGYAPSAVEVLRIVDETMEAFFALPFSKNPQYVEQLVLGVERAVQLYCEQTLSACGQKERFVPSLPALTRHSSSAFKKGSWRAGLHLQQKSKSPVQVGSTSNERNAELANMCVRINTLHHMWNEMQYVSKRLRHGWQKETPSKAEHKGHESPDKDGSFRDVSRELDKGVQFLIEFASYRVVFLDLQRVFWDGLYAGGVESARIVPVFDELDAQLGVVASVATERLRNRIVGALMKACMDCLVLVLLAGGPSRAFSVSDAELLEEDLTQLTELFTADGEGLPEDLVDSATHQIRGVLTLFHLSTESLVQRFREIYPRADAVSSNMFKSNAAVVPKTTGDWGPRDPNTLFRVLCHRADDQASKYLKKTFNLPKKISATK